MGYGNCVEGRLLRGRHAINKYVRLKVGEELIYLALLFFSVERLLLDHFLGVHIALREPFGCSQSRLRKAFLPALAGQNTHLRRENATGQLNQVQEPDRRRDRQGRERWSVVWHGVLDYLLNHDHQRDTDGISCVNRQLIERPYYVTECLRTLSIVIGLQHN